MSEVAAPRAPADGRQPMAVSFQFLLSLYAVLPLGALLVLLDMTVLDRQLWPFLSQKPAQWFAYLYLFNWPHIFASQFSLFDREYLNAYRWKLKLGVPLVAGAALLGFWAHYRLADLVFEVVTLYHVLFQQLGIARTMLRETPRGYELWKWAGLVIFVMTAHMAASGAWWLRVVPVVLAIAITPLAANIAKAAASRVGRDYVWANHALLFGIAAFGLTEYIGLAIFVPRVVHDLTGFSFYVVHDTTRNAEAPRNALYRLTGKLGVPPAIAGPALALGANAVFMAAGWTRRYFPVFAVIGFIHYFTESIIWKRHTVHRRHIAFAP